MMTIPCEPTLLLRPITNGDEKQEALASRQGFLLECFSSLSYVVMIS